MIKFKILGIALVFTILISTTLATTSDHKTFCNKYLLWSKTYEGWLQDEHCR